MKINDQENSHVENKENEQKSEESRLESIQNWMYEHKLITGIAAAAVLYMIGGRRLRQLASFAVRSGVTAGVTNAALSVFGAKPVSDKSEENVYH